MKVIPSPPSDINDTLIFRLLRGKSTEKDGLAAKVQEFLAVAIPMVDLVAAGPFRNYTLHNRDHAKKLIHLAEHLVPSATLESLSGLECLLIIYAAFLHDMGMVVTSTERSRILASGEFQDSVRGWPEIAAAISQVRAQLNKLTDSERPVVETLLHQLHEAALAAYLRPRHATHQRYRELCSQLRIAANAPDLFSFGGVSFEEWLIEICVSHNLDASVLSESKGVYEDRFPRDLIISQHIVNTQFCAALLRLSDILDFDRERTPRILFESLGIPESDIPGADVSLQEWEKHMSVHTLEVREDEFVISAECHHPAIEKAIRDFSMLIEREIRDTAAVLKRNPQSVLDKYSFELPLSVRPRITSIGYVYRDLSLRLNQSAIIALLMGERLYSHGGVALRELIQNSLDACDVRRQLQREAGYTPAIRVSADVDKLGKIWIEVADNGIGMDEYVLSEYFLKLGDTYYDSAEFKRQFAKLQVGTGPFNPISRFGIGIVSVFMLADVLEVRTSSAFSPRDDWRGRLVRIERLGGLAFVADSPRDNPGTTIRIRLRAEIASLFEKFSQELASYLRWLFLRPAFLVQIALGPGDLTFYIPNPGGVFFRVSPDGKQLLNNQGYEVVVVELERWSDRLSGVVILLLGRGEDGQLTSMKNGRQIVFQQNDPRAIDPYLLVPEYKGNRITVNGLRVKTFKTKHLFRFGRPSVRFAFLLDVDAAGSDEFEFDVSRERLTRKGEGFLRREITDALVAALADIGIMERLTSDLRLSMPTIPWSADELRTRLNSKRKPDALQELFDAVRNAIPAGRWPKGMAHDIAKQIGVRNTLVSKVISRLLQAGLVEKPQ